MDKLQAWCAKRLPHTSLHPPSFTLVIRFFFFFTISFAAFAAVLRSSLTSIVGSFPKSTLCHYWAAKEWQEYLLLYPRSSLCLCVRKKTLYWNIYLVFCFCDLITNNYLHIQRTKITRTGASIQVFRKHNILSRACNPYLEGCLNFTLGGLQPIISEINVRMRENSEVLHHDSTNTRTQAN